MTDIELVIKLPEKIINRILEYKEMSYTNLVIEAIYHGIPLPKRHGRIIDESQITGTFIWDNGYIECYAPTIIEADMAESEEHTE